MKVQQDPLFDLFKQEVDAAMFEVEEEQLEEKIIFQVVKNYMNVINRSGFVPSRLYKFLEQDVREDVIHMMKKSTYGYFNFDDYRKRRRHLVNKLKTRGC